MADGDAPSSTAQPLSSTGELALPGQGTVTSSGRRCVMQYTGRRGTMPLSFHLTLTRRLCREDTLP